MTKTSRSTCLPPGHSSSSARAVTSWAEFNQEGHHVCLAHKTTDSLAFSQSHSPLPSPDLYRGSAECQVQLQYQLSGIGVRSKWDSEKTEIHTPTPNHTMKLRSNPPPPPPPPHPRDGRRRHRASQPVYHSHLGQTEGATAGG